MCLNNSYKPITDDPAFTLSQSSDDKALDQCTNQRTVSYYFNFTQVTNGTSLRCLATAQHLNITVATNCFPVVLRSPGKTHLLIAFSMNNALQIRIRLQLISDSMSKLHDDTLPLVSVHRRTLTV